MPNVITLKDGKNETLFNVDDFIYLIEKYMGYDAANYFRLVLEVYNLKVQELIEEYEEKLSNLREKLKAAEDCRDE